MTVFSTPSHSYISGLVLGIAMAHGVDLTVLSDDDGNYMNRFELKDALLPDNVRVFINVEPPVQKADTQ
jgi:hypothetical protein